MNPYEILNSKGRTFEIVNGGETISLNSLRRFCFTSTNFPKLINMHPFCDKKALFRAKTGILHATAGNANQHRGIRMERIALAKFSDVLGQPVFALSKWFRHPRFHSLVGSPDGVTTDGKLIEIKCPCQRNFWIPRHHELQMRWDQWVMDVDASYYVQLIDDAVHFDVLQRDDTVVLDNLSHCLRFVAQITSVNDEL